MDTSNPVVAADRRSIAEVLEIQKLRRRQDISYLGGAAKVAQRIVLPVESELLDGRETREIVSEFFSTIPKISTEKNEPLPAEVLTIMSESMPICGILDSTGVPLHPPSNNNSGGCVSARRVMGGSPGVPLGLGHIVEVLGPDVLRRKHVYTSGTWKGFVTRLGKQMGRKTVSIEEAYTKELGIKVGSKFLIDRLNKLFPRRKTDWPPMDADLGEHLDRIKITATSSAGAPYWRNKNDCLSEVLEVGIPLVVKAIKEGQVTKLYRENPELFLCEVKNKLDRYEISKLEEKTRPYCAIPAHWALLFSVLTQRFQEGLLTFDQVDSVNAYGFSSAEGGLERFYEWMMTANRRGKVIVYGDDSCLVVEREGKVIRVDPDFQQMDGSLDAKDMELTVDWVMASLALEDDAAVNPFWKSVSHVWKKMACDPPLIVDGKTIYRKVRPNGLLSGIPGTTLFDTVKSALMWDLYLDVVEMRGLDPLDKNFAVNFMGQYGLVVKEGTWAPAEVPRPVPGVLLTDHKFLGVQVLVEEYEGELVFVPTIPYEDMVEMLVVQKDNPFEKTKSELTAKRRLFDRMRGLMITFGFTNPIITDAIHNVVNNIDPLAILLCTAIEGGEKPDHILLEDFAYPDSAGFPTREFCMNLYKGTGKKVGWQQIYPSLEPLLQDLRAESREVRVVVNKIKEDTEWGKKRDTGSYGVEYEEDKEARGVPHNKEFDVLDSLHKPQNPDFTSNYNKRSNITDVQGRDVGKFLPSLGESIGRHLSVTKLDTFANIKERFYITTKALKMACVDFGYYCTGFNDEDLVSLYPIQTPVASEQEQVAQETIKRVDLVSKGVQRRVGVKLEQDKPKPEVYIETAPSVVAVKFELLEPIDSFEPTSGDFLRDFGVYMGRMPNIKSFRWAPGGVKVNTKCPVGVRLEVVRIPHMDDITTSHIHGPPNWEQVAFGRSINKKLAQQYVAKAIIKHFSQEAPESRYTTGYPEPEENEADWAQEAEDFQNYEQWKDPQVENLVEDPFYGELRNFIFELQDSWEKEFGMQTNSRGLYTYGRELFDYLGYTPHEVLARVKARHEVLFYVHRMPVPEPDNGADTVLEPATEENFSKRSRLSPSKRKSLNKRNNQRQKRKNIAGREALKQQKENLYKKRYSNYA